MYKKTKKYFLVMVAFLLAPGLTNAAPNISEVSGIISDGQSIAISGSSFGASGPTVLIFDPAEGITGQTVSTSARVGTWNQSHWVYSNLSAHSGTTSASIYDQTAALINKIVFSAATEIFISYWVRIPDGTEFPNTTGAGPGEFPSESTWKFGWLLDGDNANNEANHYDLCPATHVSQAAVRVTGNDGTPVDSGGNLTQWHVSDWWSWTAWNRMTIWLHGNGSDPYGYGDVWLQGLPEGGTQFSQITHPTVFLAGMPAQWTQLNLPGWIRTNSTDGSYPLYDDVYLAAGPNSQARVEIGNASTYSACTNLAIATPISWSSTSITATVNGGSFTANDLAYLFVIDENGDSSVGFPITFGSGSFDIMPPGAPSGLSVS